ncbi:MAG: hypothetical protein ABIF87_07265 [Pseudomonadota bacterium]
MKKTPKTTLVVLGILLTAIIGCGGSSKPSNALIESEFRHAWYAIHGESGKKGWGWNLQQIEIGGVSVDRDSGTAKASIKFTYLASGGTYTKTGDFVFRRFGDKWEIDDREGIDSLSKTKFQMTP